MKQIQAIVQPVVANTVIEALHRVEGISGVMASEMRCTSAARGLMNPDINVKIELFVANELEDEVLRVIQATASTGRKGDGRIFVVDVEKTVTISSGALDVS